MRCSPACWSQVGGEPDWVSPPSACWLLLLSIAWQVAASRADRLMVTFLDVGTGDAILVQVPGGYNLLIDGGGTYDGRFDVGARVVAPVLLDRHIRFLDLVALTHTHPNHARGLDEFDASFSYDGTS